MAPLLATMVTPAPRAWSTQINPRSITRQSIGIRDGVRREASNLNCKHHRTHGIDFGPCGNPYINYTSLFLIFFLVASICSAAYSKTNRSKREGPANVRAGDRTIAADGRTEEVRIRLQAWMQKRHDEHPRRKITTRVATDISDQQVQLSRRMSELRARMLSTQEEFRSFVAARQTELRSPHAAHIRDRVGEWEQYQSRSPAASIDTVFDRARSDTQRTDSDVPEVYPVNLWHRDLVLTPLPAYASEDPLAAHSVLPAYNS